MVISNIPCFIIQLPFLSVISLVPSQFPVTIRRMRFFLSQLHVCHPPYVYPSWPFLKDCAVAARSTVVDHGKWRNKQQRVQIAKDAHYLISSEKRQHLSHKFPIPTIKPTNGYKHGIRGHLYEIYHQMPQKRTPTGTKTSRLKCKMKNQKVLASGMCNEDMTVTGLYIQHSSRPSQKVIFWIYGGAFLAGDSRGNLGIAEKMGMMCGVGSDDIDGSDDVNGGSDSGMRDVFIPDYRLVPEFHLDDAIHDVMLAYEYLLYERGINPNNVTLLGISSGGGLVVLLLQALAEARRKFEETSKLKGLMDDDKCSYVRMPAGGVLMCPFVDYTEPRGSMKEYIKHDLIVNQGCEHFELNAFSLMQIFFFCLVIIMSSLYRPRNNLPNFDLHQLNTHAPHSS